MRKALVGGSRLADSGDGRPLLLSKEPNQAWWKRREEWKGAGLGLRAPNALPHEEPTPQFPPKSPAYSRFHISLSVAQYHPLFCAAFLFNPTRPPPHTPMHDLLHSGALISGCIIYSPSLPPGGPPTVFLLTDWAAGSAGFLHSAFLLSISDPLPRTHPV